MKRSEFVLRLAIENKVAVVSEDITVKYRPNSCDLDSSDDLEPNNDDAIIEPKSCDLELPEYSDSVNFCLEQKSIVQDVSDSALEEHNSNFTQVDATEYAQIDFGLPVSDLLKYENKINLKNQSDIPSSPSTIVSDSVTECSDTVHYSGFEDSCSEISEDIILTRNPEQPNKETYFAEPMTTDYTISFFNDSDNVNNMQCKLPQNTIVNTTNAKIKQFSAIKSAVPNSVPDSHHEIIDTSNLGRSDIFGHEVSNNDFQDFESSGSEYIPSDSSLSCESSLDMDITDRRNRRKKTCKIIKETQDETTNSNNIEISIFNKKTDNVNTEESKENKYHRLETKSREKAQTKEDHLSFPDSNHDQQYTKKPCARERPTICPLCYEDVITHFPRHLFRRHKNNPQVKQIKSLKAGSKERLAMVTALRKQGYFLLNVEKKIVIPTRTSKNPNTDYFVCYYCLGHYTKQLLYKHVKICKQKPYNIVGAGRNCLSASQTFLASAVARNEEFLKTSRIKNEVLQIMRPDDISMLAKSDPLICLFGEYLLVKHKRRQIAVAISNKMREMARMLQVIRSSKPDTKSFFDLLKPEMFGTLIFAAKVISGYDEQEKDFKAPSLALHMGTNLKQICDVAFKLVLENKKISNICWDDKEQKKSEIKDLKKIIEGHWCNEISSLALKTLQENKWKKPTQLPLANDIVVFQSYLNNLAEKAYESIIEQIEIKRNYKILTECVLALTVMFNRKRVGDVQYVTIQTYNRGNAKVEQQTLSESLTPLEKIISRQFKRIVTGGKGSRPVPIIFSKLMQKYITCLLKIRQTSDIVPKTNPYLFANPGSIDKWMAGANIIRRLANNSQAQQPALLTSTRFRKHIATTLQLMTLEPEDMEQIATFMGHTQKTHAEFYRLPQDVYQTAKVAKILLMLEKGKGSEFKGKTLSEIQLDENVFNSDSDIDEDGEDNVPLAVATSALENVESTFNFNVTSDNFDLESNPGGDNKEKSEKRKKRSLNKKEITANIKKTVKKTKDIVKQDADKVSSEKKKISGRIRWSDQEKKIVLNYFKGHIRKKITPKKHECDDFLKLHSKKMSNKDWVRVKTYVYNSFSKLG